jgi:hypothetical protein
MSTYVYMTILESAPERYDLGIRILSFGRVLQMYDAAADADRDSQGNDHPPRELHSLRRMSRSVPARRSLVRGTRRTPGRPRGDPAIQTEHAGQACDGG